MRGTLWEVDLHAHEGSRTMPLLAAGSSASTAPAAFTPEAFSKVTRLRPPSNSSKGGGHGADGVEGQCVCEAGSAGLVLGGSHHKTGTVTSTSPEPVHPNPFTGTPATTGHHLNPNPSPN